MSESVKRDEAFQRHRQWLRDKLEIGPWLARRELFPLTEIGVHAELYHFHPDAPTLIFLPGIGTYVELYAETLGRLSERGFNVLAIDPPGHGYSSGKRGVYQVEQMDEAVSLAINQLSERYRGAFGLFGFSIGSLLAISAAEQDSRVDSVLCGTLLLPELPPDLIHWAGWQWTWSSAFFFPQLSIPLGNLVDFRLLLAGHPAGDAVLTEAARRMQAVLRPADLLARVGGEEFMAVLPGATEAEAGLAAIALCNAINSTPFQVPGAAEPVKVTISIGAVIGGAGHDSSTAALVEKADQALYDAKNAGRNQVTLSPECTQAA